MRSCFWAEGVSSVASVIPGTTLHRISGNRQHPVPWTRSQELKGTSHGFGAETSLRLTSCISFECFKAQELNVCSGLYESDSKDRHRWWRWNRGHPPASHPVPVQAAMSGEDTGGFESLGLLDTEHAPEGDRNFRTAWGLFSFCLPQEYKYCPVPQHQPHPVQPRRPREESVLSSVCLHPACSRSRWHPLCKPSQDY